MLGCYRHMRQLLRRLGTEDGFGVSDHLTLDYQAVGSPAARLQLSAMSPILALPLALLRFPALSVWEKMKALMGLPATLFPGRGRSLETWLRRYGQAAGIRAHLWDPLCRAIMNAEASEVDAAVFFKTLRRAFGGSAADAAIWIPGRPWSELIGEPALEVMSAAGVDVQLGKRVESLRSDSGRLAEIGLSGGEQLQVGDDDLVFSAMPWHALARLLPGVLPAEGIASSPILSVYCEAADSTGLPETALLVLVGAGPFHFFCRRENGQPGEFALLAAGAEMLRGLAVDEIRASARRQLQNHFPGFRVDGEMKMQVLREERATMIVAPGDDRLRPKPGLLKGLANFYVCGDWTATGLPSTLESAAESATTALADLG
jgi:hypothetical protein